MLRLKNFWPFFDWSVLLSARVSLYKQLSSLGRETKRRWRRAVRYFYIICGTNSLMYLSWHYDQLLWHLLIHNLWRFGRILRSLDCNRFSRYGSLYPLMLRINFYLLTSSWLYNLTDCVVDILLINRCVKYVFIEALLPDLMHLMMH